MSLRDLACVSLVVAVVPAASFAQICPVPCNGTQIVCHHQNGIRDHRGDPTVPLLGPNALAGNVQGDAFWKVWGIENGMSRGSGLATFTNWEIGADNTPAGGQGGTGTLYFDIPDLELRPVTLAGTVPGVREPDLTVPPIYGTLIGAIALPTGAFRINVSILTPTVAIPASCPTTTSLPVLSNADVAMLFLLTAAAPGLPNYYENLQTITEVNTISNPSVPPGVAGNSYSGSVDALVGAVTHMAINQELFAEMGFYEPTLEAYRRTAGLASPMRGSGARELAPGDILLLLSEDWESGARAVAGQDRLAAVVLADDSLGSPLGLAPPGNPPGFLAGSLFLPNSAGMLALYATAVTGALLPFSATLGAGLDCHSLAGVATCTWTTGSGPNAPSVFSDMQATTARILVPPGLAGQVLYAAAFYLNLTTLTLDDGSNTVELLFL